MLSLCIPASVGGAASTGRIIEPTSAAPAQLRAGDTLRAVAKLRLPLTPPPGVQQPDVWKGWRVRLARRVAIALDGASPVVEYPARLLRIRPDRGDRYVITATTPPWLLPGQYDLTIEGPGFEGLAAGAVIVTDSRGEGGGPRGEWRLRHGAIAELTWVGSWSGRAAFEVVVPGVRVGLRATVERGDTRPRQLLELDAASWTTAPGANGEGAARLLRFRLDPPLDRTADSGKLAVDLERVDTGACRAEIRWSESSNRAGPTDWRELSFRGVDDAVSILWDFGDGDHGAGRNARHRWIFDERSRVSATGFDRYGAACTAETMATGQLASGRGCGCTPIGRRRAAAPDLLGFFLSVALARE